MHAAPAGNRVRGSGRRSRLVILLAALTLNFWNDPRAENAPSPEPYVFGVFPYLPTRQIESLYAEVAVLFSKATGRAVVLRSRPDFDAFRQEVAGEAYDIILIQPFDYVRVAASHGYVPLARMVPQGDKENSGTMNALFVSRADDSINGVEGFKGKVVVMPSKEAAVSVLGRLVLDNAGYEPGQTVEVKYVSNHFSCLQQVVVRKADLCVTAIAPLRLFEERAGTTSLKVVAESPRIPSPLYAVHCRIPPADRVRLKAEILSWTSGSTPHLNMVDVQYFVPAKDSDYDSVRTLWRKLGGE
jgi:phosphonate transport system substrate-binding protein